MDPIQTIALSAGLAWASGLRLYLVVFPAGALLAAFAMGEVDPAWTVAAGLLGGTITAGTHFAKAGSRLAINTSPEPFSNWLASFGEEGMVLGGLWAMLASPALFLGLLAIFLVLAGWLLLRFWRLLRGVFGRRSA